MRQTCKRYVILALAAIAGPMLSVVVSLALTIERGPAPTIRSGYDPDVAPACNLRLKGEIVEGDIQRLIVAITRFGRSEWDQFDLCLDSRGGRFLEALKIVEYLLKGVGRGTATIVESGAECLSACALIFMAGNVKGEHSLQPLRYLHAQGRLGFHAPFLPQNAIAGDRHSAQTVVSAYRAAVSASRKIIALLGSAGDVEGVYQNEPWMRSSLIQAMLAQGEGEMLMIDTVDKAGRWAIEIYGVPRHFSIGAEAVAVACWNAGGWIKDQFSYYTELKGGFTPDRVKESVDSSARVMRFSTGLSDAPDDCAVRGGDVAVEKRGVHRMMLPVVFFRPTLSLKVIARTGWNESMHRGGSTESTVEYRIAANVSLGVLRMRNGPGVNCELVTEIPAGSIGVRVAEQSCRLADDGRSRYRWCRATWQGHSGWVSMVGLIK